MDVFSTTNGGEGLPWWMGDYMQSNIKGDSATWQSFAASMPYEA